MDQLMSDALFQLGGLFAAMALLAYGAAVPWLALRPAATMADLMPSRAALVFAVAATAVWALLWSLFGPGSVELAIGGAVRNLGFLVWLAATFGPARGYGRALSMRLALLTLLVINLVTAIFSGLALLDLSLAGKGLAAPLWLARPLGLVDMLTASAGLVLTENLVRHKHAQMRMPLLVIAGGMAALWVYALNIHLLGWLAGRPPMTLMLIEPLAVLLVLPVFIFAALDTGRERIRLSRTIAVRTLAVMGLLIYLTIIAVAGALARVIGGDYGDLAQGVLLSTAMGGVILMLLSPRARAWLLVIISKHFFEHRYDYRSEWMRFTATLEGSDGEGEATFKRVARALAALTESPGAVIFVGDDAGDFLPADHWHWPTAMDNAHQIPVRTSFALKESERIIDLDAVRSNSDADAGLPLPAWLVEDSAAWVLLPLPHLGRLVGIALLQRPAVVRPLDWEDLDVLRISSRQAASHIAEVQSQTALSEARRFDEFNRRFAFIMHDVKNLASQLGLLAANAERHAENPEFRADMIETLKLSVARMNELLQRLSAKRASAVLDRQPVSLAPLLDQLARESAPRHPVTAGCDIGLYADGDLATVRQILGHLLTNAIDASSADAPVILSATREADQARIDVIDHGVGMSRDFVRNQLFKPFVSTKDNGFGLGAFEALQLARALGGRIEIDSREGEGTRSTLWLPLAAAQIEEKERAA